MAATHNPTNEFTTDTRHDEELDIWMAYILGADGFVVQALDNVYKTERGAKIAASIVLRSYAR